MLEDNAKMLRALNALPPDDNDSKYLKFVIKRGEEQCNIAMRYLILTEADMDIADAEEAYLTAVRNHAAPEIIAELRQAHIDAVNHYRMHEDDLKAYIKSISPTVLEKEQPLRW
jgi:predicted outer membrane protein